MKYKILGAILAGIGLFLIIKYDYYLFGLICLIAGYLLAMEIGTRSD